MTGGAAAIWQVDENAPEIEGLDADGRPDPAYAAALGLLPAGPGQRVLATLLELIVAVVLAVPGAIAGASLALQGVGDPPALMARADLLWLVVPVIASNALITVFTVVQLILHGRRGVTLGKAAFGLRTVNVRTLQRPGFWRGAVVRYLVLGVSFVVPLIGPVLVIALSPLFDAEHRGRGWPDRAAATWMVDVRRGLNPYDAKRMRIARKQHHAELPDEAPVLPSLATPVDRDAPAVYVPSGRFSGGVIGVHRAPAPAAPAKGSETFAPVGPQSPQAPWQPPVIAPTAAAAPADDVRAVLVIDDGGRIEVRTTTLIGRSPAAGEGEGGARLVPVADDTRSVSKTHLGILLSRRGVVAVDRGSTNGSAIVRDGVEQPLTPGVPADLRTGDVLRFGDRSLLVERA